MNRPGHRLLYLVPALFLLPVLARPAAAQSRTVSVEEAKDHLLQHDDPIYPPIAKAAHVHGDVVLRIDIDRAGNVTAVEAVSGPQMLQPAAVGAEPRERD